MLNYLHDYHIFPHPDRGKGKGGEDVFRVLQPKLGFTNVVFFGIHLDWDWRFGMLCFGRSTSCEWKNLDSNSNNESLYGLFGEIEKIQIIFLEI